MMYTKAVLEEAVKKVDWFHSIELPYRNPDVRGIDGFGILTTPGKVNHCTVIQANRRFGMPDSFRGKTVLDVGAWDGYFSFEAERRGAHEVTAIDPLHGCSGVKQSTEGFAIAHNALNSNVNFYQYSLQDYLKVNNGRLAKPVDVSLYYGVLYHVDDPLTELKTLAKITRDYALIETATSTRRWSRGAMWELKPNFDKDNTNRWYPTLDGLIVALKHAGFSQVQLIYRSVDRSRITVKAIK